MFIPGSPNNIPLGYKDEIKAKGLHLQLIEPSPYNYPELKPDEILIVGLEHSNDREYLLGDLNKEQFSYYLMQNNAIKNNNIKYPFYIGRLPNN